MSIVKHFSFLKSDLILECPAFDVPKNANEIAYSYGSLLRHNMKHNISFFKHGELVKHQMMGKYDDLSYIQLYKFTYPETMYVLMTSYIGSCDGCFFSRYKDTYNKTGSIIDILYDVMVYNVSKCEVVYDEGDAINAYYASEQRIFNSNATV